MEMSVKTLLTAGICVMYILPFFIFFQINEFNNSIILITPTLQPISINSILFILLKVFIQINFVLLDFHVHSTIYADLRA